jgi:hypothetical protein
MYTDPGSGLFLIQIIVAAALTAVYRFRQALASIFRKERIPDTDGGSD